MEWNGNGKADKRDGDHINHGTVGRKVKGNLRMNTTFNQPVTRLNDKATQHTRYFQLLNKAHITCHVSERERFNGTHG